MRKFKLILSICHDFGVGCDLSFNTDKAHCSFVGYLIGDIFPKFIIGGRVVPKTKLLVCLGVTFKLGNVLNVDFSDNWRKFMSSVRMQCVEA